MLRYAFPVCLWLIAIAKADFQWTYRFAAPEMLNYSVAKAFYEVIKDQSHHQLKVRVQTQQFDRNTIDTDCTLTLSARPDTVAMNISAFRRISRGSVLLAWYDEKPYGRDRNTTVTIVELLGNSYCSLRNVLSAKGNPIIVPSNDTLDVFVNDRCPQANENGPRCRYSYPLKIRLGIPRQSAFNVDFDWASIRIERRTKAPKDFVVRGFRGDNYKVMRMSHSTGELRELMSLPNPDRQLEMISTDLTFCRIANPGHDTAVNCDQFNEENKLIHSTHSSFDQPMMLMTVGSERQGMIEFLTAKINCTDRDDCWNFKRSSFNNATEEKPLSLNIACKGMNRKAWVTLESNAIYTSPSLCIPSGDVLPNNPECHRDAYGHVYCIKSCTRL